MVNATHISFAASDRSYYSIIKKEIHNKALEAGFDPQRVAELDIIIAELTSNLHKYAKDGEILFAIEGKDDTQYVEVISIDNGPGMSDPGRMMTDGYSSSNTIGHGLGSIKRLSDKFELYSLKGWGTIVLSRVYKKEPREFIVVPKMDVKGIVVAKPGEKVSGDGYYYSINDEGIKLLIGDGLGHGPEAYLAVSEAIKAFKSLIQTTPVDLLRNLHQSIRKTRGMVGTVLTFNFTTSRWKIAGIGNISGKLLSVSGFKNHISYNGIIGHNIPNTMNDQDLSVADYQQVIFCSDGIKSRWDLSKYTSIHRYDLTILAAAIYKDYARRTDDMSVLICKISR